MLYEVLNSIINVTGKVKVMLAHPGQVNVVTNTLENVKLENKDNQVILSGLSYGINKDFILDPESYKFIEAFTEYGGFLLDVKDAEFFHGQPYEVFFSNDGENFEICIEVAK